LFFLFGCGADCPKQKLKGETKAAEQSTAALHAKPQTDPLPPQQPNKG
jgi:hypothetical protein